MRGFLRYSKAPGGSRSNNPHLKLISRKLFAFNTMLQAKVAVNVRVLVINLIVSRTEPFSGAVRPSPEQKSREPDLVGEKLLNYIRASDLDPSRAAKLPLFAAET